MSSWKFKITQKALARKAVSSVCNGTHRKKLCSVISTAELSAFIWSFYNLSSKEFKFVYRLIRYDRKYSFFY